MRKRELWWNCDPTPRSKERGWYPSTYGYTRRNSTRDGLPVARDAERIRAEAALDEIDVVRTSVPVATRSAEQTVRAYTALGEVERAFRRDKRLDLKGRPISHRLSDRVRAPVFLCMLAYSVEWHRRRALAPLRFDDDDPAAGAARRASVVAPAQRSPRAARNAHRQRTDAGWPVHSFQTLPQDLATVAKNRVCPTAAGAVTFEVIPLSTALQQHAFDLLGVSPRLRMTSAVPRDAPFSYS